MVFETIEQSAEFAVAALDGVHGWLSEVIATLIFVLFFNFILKSILKNLHRRFETKKEFYKDSFVKALYQPLSVYVWFFAVIQMIDLIASRTIFEKQLPFKHMILEAGAVIAIAWFLLRWKKEIVQYSIQRSKNREITIDRGKIDAIDKIATVAIYFFTILILLEVTNRSIATLIAFGGVGGLALAFASQEIISNFFGGFMIHMTQPFAIGDWIQIPSQSIEGHVEEIGWYMTRIRSFEKRPIYVPNSVFTKLVMITPSRMTHRLIKDNIGIRYQDMDKAENLAKEIAEMLSHHPEIDHHLSSYARVSAFSPYSVDILFSCYTPSTENEEFLRVKENVLLKISDLIKKHGAEMAFPTQHINLEQLPSPK